jgi:NDP-sugar pyrophosphorylase family protein
MLSVGETLRPFLDYLIENIAAAGYRDVAIVVRSGDDTIPRYYTQSTGAERFSSLRFSFVEQPIPPGRVKPLGTAEALQRAVDALPDWRNRKFTVCNSDNLYSVNALSVLLLDHHRNAMIDYDRAALQFGQERIARFSVIRKDEEGFLTDIIEKPTVDQIKEVADRNGRIGVSMNIFRFSGADIHPFLEAVPLHPLREERELPYAVQMMVQRFPAAVYCHPISEHVPDLTDLKDISSVDAYLAHHRSGGGPSG